MKAKTVFAICVLILLAGCGQLTTQPAEPNPSATPNLPNPASVYCEQQGYRLEIRTAQDGSQSGVCIFPDGSECDEWAFYRHECTPATQDASMPNPASVFCEQQGYAVDIRTASDGSQSGVCIFPDGSECDEWAFFRGDCNAPATPAPLAIPTALPIDPAASQGWATYTLPQPAFSFKLPDGWVVEEAGAEDPLLVGHELNIHSVTDAHPTNIRLTFRQAGDDTPLWPSGVGEGEFIQQGTLEIAGQPIIRTLLVCPSGAVTAIWYHQAADQPNITAGSLEFGIIFSTPGHCEPGNNLVGESQQVGETILASMTVP